jgi:putative membrane protein (TIGR04086 family)
MVNRVLEKGGRFFMKTSLKSKKGLNYIKIIKGVVNAYLITLFLFLLLGGVLYFTKITESIIPHSVIVLSAISIVVSGVNATRDIEYMGWLHGGLIGILYVAILLIAGLFIGSAANFGFQAMIDLALGFAVGAVAGALGVNL